jgi:hypothetical protein
MEQFAPGVEILEKDSLPTIQTSGAQFSGIVSTAQRGPDNVVTLLSGMEQFKKRYGYYGGTFLGYLMANGYFDQLGVGLFFVRATHHDGVTGVYVPRVMNQQLNIIRTISAITNANPARVTTSVAHGFVRGQKVRMVDVTGMTQVSGNVYVVTPHATDPTIFFLDGCDSTAYGVFIAGTVEGYAESSIIQASSTGAWANSTLLTCQKYALSLNAETTAGASTCTPASIAGMEVGDVVYLEQYLNILPNIVTAINTGTNQVTFRTALPATVAITSMTVGAPGAPIIVTKAGHGLKTGQYVKISGNTRVTGLPTLNANWVIARTGADTFTLDGSDSINYTDTGVGSYGNYNLTWDTGAYLKSTNTHRTKTALSVAYTSGTQIQVLSAATINVGALLLLVTSTRVVEGRVVSKNGNILNVTITKADGTATLPVNTLVVSVNFDLLHQVDGTTTRYEGLSCESEDNIDHYVARFAQSEYLRGVAGDTGAGGDYKAYTYPMAFNYEAMTQGADGTTPDDTDKLGTNTNKAYKHGMALFDSVPTLPQFAVPGGSVTVQRAADTYAQSRGDTINVIAAPETSDTQEELLAFRNVTLNLVSSYTALYAPWGREPNPDIPGAYVNVPPEGRILGMISEVSKRRGIQKPPANELVKFASLVASFTPTEHGVLNAAGVNLILMEEGRGIRCMGARTLWPNADRKQYLNVRSILNGVKRGLKEFGKAIAFEASDDLLWKYIQTEGNKWMEQRWKDGWFFPRNDKTKAFFFKCDATTNTEELRLSAKVRSVVGINPVLPGELIQFELMLWDGGVVAVNEL